MSVIGNPLITTNYISDSFSGDASTVAFTLSQAPASAASIAVYISGLYQIPTSAYSISGTTLTFTGAPPTGTNNITVLHLGVKSATLVPVAGSVTPQMLSNNTAIYWSASNNNVGFGNNAPIAPVQVGSLGASYTVTPSNPLAILASNINGYNQLTTQNANSGTNASNDLIVSNDLGTDSTNYGDFGINSSGFSGSGAFSDAGGVYLYAQSNTLAIGTASAASLKLSTNNAVAMTIDSSGSVGVNSTPTTGYKVTIDNGSPTTGDYSPLLIKGGSSSENGGQLGFWNTYAGVSNPKKWIRVDNSGKLGIINSGYTAQIFSLDDSGNMTTAGTLTTSSRGISKSSLPTGSVLQVVTNYPTNGAVYSQAVSSYTEITTAYRTSITPISSSSILILEWVGLIGGNNTGAISTMKFYDVTNSAEVGLSGFSLGSRGIGHASFRQVDTDANDRDNIILRAVVPSSSTTARTYGIYHYSESSATKYFNATATDNNGCSYVKWHFIITEIAA